MPFERIGHISLMTFILFSDSMTLFYLESVTAASSSCRLYAYQLDYWDEHGEWGCQRQGFAA